MFTGIISDLGTITQIINHETRKSFAIATNYDLENIALGASIACDGVCLTVTHKEHNAFLVDVSVQTLSCTNLNNWKIGQKINLERALRMGDELGGHLVSGHVDGIATIKTREEVGDCLRIMLEYPPELAVFITEKGSVTLNGVSLTVTHTENQQFGIMLIPHSLAQTNLAEKQLGESLNLEIDMLARYVEKMLKNK